MWRTERTCKVGEEGVEEMEKGKNAAVVGMWPFFYLNVSSLPLQSLSSSTGSQDQFNDDIISCMIDVS